MIVLILMQSGFVMADSFTSNQSRTISTIQSYQFETLSTDMISAHKPTSEEATTGDECLDCNSLCCPCCATLSLTFVTVHNEMKIDQLHLYSINSARLEVLYYSFLRPPIV